MPRNNLRNRKPIKKTRKINKKQKKTKIKKSRNNKLYNSKQLNFRKTNKKTRKLAGKYFEWKSKQQIETPGLAAAKKLIQQSIKGLKKNNKNTKAKSIAKLVMAAAIIGSYAPVEQQMDLGRLGTRQSGFPGAISDPNILVKYHNPVVNPKSTVTFSNRELKHLKQRLPKIYEDVTF